ncbi:MAG: hypothetical protein RQ936_09020, partial [Gammaproteobacteria bacterium]|nr:hypothetical protein [Gammaproteobacteria bacterium]
MKISRFKNWSLTAKAAVMMTMASSMLVITPAAQATPSFARLTGAECLKCHTSSFPRLNWTGERFMRNGFALPKTGEALDVGFSDETDTTQKSTSDLALVKDVGNILSVRGKMTVWDQPDTDSATKSLGSPTFFALFGAGQLAPDVPFWAEAEINTATGETEVHNYFVGWTNVLKDSSPGSATLVNFRAGGFTPTEWTSVNDQKRSIDSASSHPGAYRGKSGFTQVGNGLGTKTAVEYYGYSESFFWAAAVGNDTGANFHDANRSSGTQYWLVGRFDFMEGSSVSLLHMNYGVDNASADDLTSDTLSANWRIGTDVDLRAQYSVDNSGDGAVDDVSGYTLQGDWNFVRGLTGILRYDTTDNGAAVDSEATQATAALAWAPWQNIKLTAAYVNEMETASTDPEADSMSLQL